MAAASRESINRGAVATELTKRQGAPPLARTSARIADAQAVTRTGDSSLEVLGPDRGRPANPSDDAEGVL